MAGDVVPVDAVTVEIVQQGQTVFRSSVLEFLSVVRLGPLDSAIEKRIIVKVRVPIQLKSFF